MKFLLICALCLIDILLIASPIPVADGLFTGVLVENKIYLSSYIGSKGYVSIVNADTYEVLGRIPLLGYAGNLINIGNKVGALSQNEGIATIIDAKTQTKLATINLGNNSGPYYGVGYENKIFSTNYSQNSITVSNLDLIPPGVDPELPISTPIEAVIEVQSVPAYPMVFGDKIFLSTLTGNKIVVISGKTNQIAATLSGNFQNFVGAILGDSTYFQIPSAINNPGFVIKQDTNLIDYSLPNTFVQTAPKSILNIDAGGHIKTIGEKYIIICSFSDLNTTVSIYNVENGAQSSSIVAGKYCFIAAIKGSKAYVTSYDDNKIFIFDAKNIENSLPILVASINGEGSPTQAIVYGDRLFITNRNHSSLSVFDTNTNQFVDTSLPQLTSFNHD